MAEPYLGAFRSQIATLRSRLAAGMPRRGWKVGVNVPEVQAKLGLPHALVGWLDGDHVFANAAAIAAPTASLLHVEPELCLRMAAAVPVDSDTETAGRLVAALAPALELVDYAKPTGGLDDLIRHSMFHFGCVLGDWRPAPQDRRIAIAACVRVRAGERESVATRTDLVPARLGDIVLRVDALLREVGESLQPGDLILSGSFTERALPIAAGQSAAAELGDFGKVRCSLTD